MLEENPKFHVYGPPPFIVGGVEIKPPYRSSDAIEEIPEIINSLGHSVDQAYGINTRVETPSENLILTRVSPLTASIDKKCIDYLIDRRNLEEHEKVAKTLFLRLKANVLHTALFARKDGFYVAHILMQKFNTEYTEFLLKTIKRTLLKLTYDKFRVLSTISDDVLRIDAEIIQPKDQYVL